MCCANYIRKGAILADIGTDHAYLPIWLLKSGLISYAYASDIAEKPLMSAEANAEKYDVTAKMQTILGPGLKNVPDTVTDIVIAGMGAEMIIGILTGCIWIKNSDKNFVFQPMKDEYLLRKWLCENGFSIYSETAVIDSSKVYTVMNVLYTGAQTVYDEIFIYMGKLEKNPESAVYGKKIIRLLEKRQMGLKEEKDIGIIDNTIIKIQQKYGV